MTKLVMFLISCIFLTACQSAEPGTKNYTYHYEDYLEYRSINEEKSSFIIKYPLDWKVIDYPFHPAHETANEIYEASPQWGIDIHPLNVVFNYFGLYGSFQTLSLDLENYEVTNLIVDERKKGTIYTNTEHKLVTIYVLYEFESDVGYYNALIMVNEDLYDKYKAEIWHIIASLEPIDG